MKKRLYAVLAALLVLGAAPAMAQHCSTTGAACVKMTPESVAKQKTEQLTEQLQLTTQQQQAVYELTLNEARQCQAKCEAMQQSGESCDSDALQRACCEGFEAKDSAMKRILTAEQYAKWREMCSNAAHPMCKQKLHHKGAAAKHK